MPQKPVRTSTRPTAPDRLAEDGADRTTWEAAVESFLREKKRMGLSPSTLELYRTLLDGPRVREFRADGNIKAAVDLTEQALKDFESALQDAGLSAGSVHQYHATLKNFAKFCIDQGMGLDAKVLTVSAPKQSKTAPGVISHEEEAKLLKAARYPRDAFIVKFLMGSGVRRAELLKLDVDDIVESADGRSYVRVRLGKGGKDRLVPLDSKKMGTELSRETRVYLDRVRPSETSSRALFLTVVKSGADYERLSASGLRSILRRLGAETCIDCNPHRFRHSYGTRAIQAGIQPFAVQKLLGHTTLDMVSVYVHYDDVSLMDAVN